MAGLDVAPHPPPAELRLFERLGRNIAWLLGSRGVSGVLSIGYLAAASRALGPSGFGVFALILAYGGAIAGLAQFKSWQAVVRYGATHEGAERGDRLARLLGYVASVDLAAALVGATVAVLGSVVAGRLIGLSPVDSRTAGLFGAALLLSTGDAASGLLRLRGRFGLLTTSETAASLTRLAGAMIVWASGGGLVAMLSVWAAAGFVEGLMEWAFVLMLCRVPPKVGPRDWRRAATENRGLWRFMVDSSIASSLAVLWQQVGTLAVGASGGPVAAGEFRVASKLAGALSKPAETATRAVLPELAALVAAEDHSLLRRLLKRATALGAVLGLLLILASVMGGGLLLRLVAGTAFTGARPFLLLLAISTAIDLGAVAIEPLLVARGLTRAIVAARLASGLVYLALLALLLPMVGPLGAAMAVVGATLVLRSWQTLAARRPL